MASAPGHLPTMISDGKRMRVLLKEGHGDGDFSSHLIDRCKVTVKVHPTWKLFGGFIPDPVVRDQNEHSHHVYLDDRACYTIWFSEQYTKQELGIFWPLDFDYFGKTKTGRPSRGRPAYLEDLRTEYAKGTMRDKKKVYVFSGSPDYLNYMPTRAGTVKTNEYALPASNDLPNIASVVASIDNTCSSAPFRSAIELGYGHIPFEPMAPRHYIASPTDSNLLPLGVAYKAIQGSPYFENPAAMYGSRPRPRGDDFAATMGIMKKCKAFELEDEEKEGMAKKKKYGVEAMEYGTNRKRFKVETEEEDEIAPMSA
jgi:hypothetical protein